MTADVIHLPTPAPVLDATNGALAMWEGRLYAKGGPGWICLAGSHHGPPYAHWTETLPPTAVLIREGL